MDTAGDSPSNKSINTSAIVKKKIGAYIGELPSGFDPELLN